MRMKLVLAAVVVAMPLSAARGEDADFSDADIAKAFEEWGEAWYRREGEKDDPEMFLHVTSSREKSGGEKLPTAIIETRLATATGILVHRNTLHFDSSPAPILRDVVESTIDDGVLESFRLRFKSASVISEVRVCVGCSQSSRDAFAKAHSWEVAGEGTFDHRDRIFKDVELMALGDAEARELKVIVGREIRVLTIKRVEDSEVDYKGKTISTRVFRVSAQGAKSRDTFWVSRDRGLVQFQRGDGPLFRRVGAKAATDALLKAERKARGWDENTFPNTDAAAIEIRICLTTEDGATIKRVVSGRETADAAAVEAALVEDVKAAKATGDSWVVVIDAGPEVPWKEVIAIMDVCKKNDITKVELAAPKPRK